MCRFIFGFEQVGLPSTDSMSVPIDPTRDLRELVGRVQETNQVHLNNLQAMLKKAEGFEFNNAVEFIEFKNVFKEATEATGVRPLLPSGRRGSLQIRRKKGTENAWPSVCARGEEVSYGVQANTIPLIIFG